jgi:predicted amidohydrolase YtcJ
MSLSGKPGLAESDFQQFQHERNRFSELGVHSIKLFVDGVIEAHTASMLSPYANRSTAGAPIFDQAELNRTIGRLDADGWQVMVHAIGDGGVRMVLDAFENALKSNDSRTTARRHRIEHMETIAEADMPRLASLAVIGSMQPMHAEPNSNIFQVWAVNLGEERSKRAWAWNSIQQLGGRIAFGTDWPVVGLDPRPGLHVAITRQTLDGRPPEGFVPSQRLSLRRALEAYTIGSAYAEGKETEKGSLEVGMLADIVVWDRDLFTLPPNEVHRANVKVTIFDGEVVVP